MKMGCFLQSLMVVALFLAVGLWIGSLTSQAASLKQVYSYKKERSVKVDVTRDGKKDTLTFGEKMDSDNNYIDKFTVKVNGKNAIALKNTGALYFGVYYLKLSAKREYLQIAGGAENDYQVINRIYAYNNKTGKFEKKADIRKIPCRLADITSVKKNKITVKFNAQYNEVGNIEWKYDYKVTDKKITLVSRTSQAVASTLGDVDYPGDGYEKLFAKNLFKVQNAFSLYTDISCKKESFTAERDALLKLSKIRMEAKKMYLMFEMDQKTGWIQADTHEFDFSTDSPQKSGLFYGVFDRMAG